MSGHVSPSGVEDSQDCVVWPTQKGPGLGIASCRSSESSGSTTTLGDGTSKKGGPSQEAGLSQWENLHEYDEDDDYEDVGYLGLLDQHGKPIPDPKEVEEKENDNPILTSNDSNKARWPPVNVLLKNSIHLEFLQALLTAVDDCGCQHVTQAKDKVEPKANAWMKLLDVCYGGMQQGRGKLAQFGFKPIMKATDLKKKVLLIWHEAAKKVSDNSVNKTIKNICEIQLAQYTKACDKETTDRAKGKEADVILQAQMATYQRARYWCQTTRCSWR
jgi:hypothetical protein